MTNPDVQNITSHNGKLLGTIDGKLHVYRNAGSRSGWELVPTKMYLSGQEATRRARKRIEKLLLGTGARVVDGAFLEPTGQLIIEIESNDLDSQEYSFSSVNTPLDKKFGDNDGVTWCYHSKARSFRVLFEADVVQTLIEDEPMAAPAPQAPLVEAKEVPTTDAGSPPPAA